MVTKYKMMKNKRKSKSKTKLLKLLRKKKTIKKATCQRIQID